MKSQSFLGGIAILFFGGLFAKVLGAFYKIPLTWILGTDGLGLYQLVFPLFSMLLIVSSTGMPTAISRLVAKYANNQQQILKCSLRFMLSLSLCASLLLLCFAKPISALQGNDDIDILYYTIAPAIVFVSVISAFRGYYQGKLNMLPTTLSNVFEQLFKLVFGLSLSAVLFRYGVLWGAFGAVAGVVASELFAMLFLLIFFLIDKRKNKFKLQNISQNLQNTQIYKLLFKTATPIVLCSVIIPLSLAIDSVLVVNLLNQSGFYMAQSLSLWGISSGVVNTLVNLPVTICACVATAIVPHLSMASKEQFAKQQKIHSSFFIVLLIALPICLCFMILPNEILKFLFLESLGQNFNVALKMLFLSGPIVLLICLLQTQTAVLQGEKKLFTPCINLLVGVVLKTAVMFFAIKAFSIYGVILSSYVLYFVATILNGSSIRGIGFKVFSKKVGTIFASGCCFALSLLVVKNWLKGASVYVSLPICFFVSTVVFLFCLICLNTEKVALLFSKLKQNVYKKFFGKKLKHN